MTTGEWIWVVAGVQFFCDAWHCIASLLIIVHKEYQNAHFLCKGNFPLFRPLKPWNVADQTLAASKESISIIIGHLPKRTSTNIFKLIYITAHVKTNHVW